MWKRLGTRDKEDAKGQEGVEEESSAGWHLQRTFNLATAS